MAGPCSLRVSLAQVHLGGTGPHPAKLLGPGHMAGSKSQGWLSVTGLALEIKSWVVRGRGSMFSANFGTEMAQPSQVPSRFKPQVLRLAASMGEEASMASHHMQEVKSWSLS